MPGGIVRLGDIFGESALIGPPASPNILVNGRPAALVGAIYSPHPCCGEKKSPPSHCKGPIGDAPVGIYFNGWPPLTKSGIGWCKHKVTTASPDVIVAGGGLLGLAMGIAGAALGGPEGLAPTSFVEKLATQIAFDAANQTVSAASRR